MNTNTCKYINSIFISHLIHFDKTPKDIFQLIKFIYNRLTLVRENSDQSKYAIFQDVLQEHIRQPGKYFATGGANKMLKRLKKLIKKKFLNETDDFNGEYTKLRKAYEKKHDNMDSTTDQELTDIINTIVSELKEKADGKTEKKDKKNTKEKKYKKEKGCPPAKILNPSTGRCVSRTGQTGKKLLNEQQKQPEVQPEVQLADKQAKLKIKKVEESRQKSVPQIKY